jgi:Protein of unknown function (DUF3303)
VLFMLIERFKDQDAVATYTHLRDKGRGMPDGLTYVGSWVEPNFDRCFQLMECEDLRLIQEWALHWRGLGTFEIVPIVTGKDTGELVNRFLPSAVKL